MGGIFTCALAATVFVAGTLGAISGAGADTMQRALVQAYQNNPSLNAQRAALRATDETVPQALSGYRPKLSITASGGYNYANTVVPNGNGLPAGAPAYSQTTQPYASGGIGAVATQTIFDGLQTPNRVRQAESQVMGARETLRVTEQQVLLDAVTAYMNLLRDKAILDLNQRNVEVLTDELQQTRTRFHAGEVTRTDIAQAESRLAGGRAALLGAQSNYATSQANYRRVIGVAPGTLTPGTPVDHLSPSTLTAAIAAGEQQNPSVMAAKYGVDIAELAVKISEGALYPNLSVTASVSQNVNPEYNVSKQFLAGVVGQLTIPIYQGGGEYATIRQSKETVGEKRLNLDVDRDQARATVVQSWSQLGASKAQIEAATVQVHAAANALDGVRQEARLGDRTTLDVLNAQQELVNARAALVAAQHDRVVASYTLLASVGGLSMERLALAATIYDPHAHYRQVRDAWFGVRTLDGR